MDHTRHVIGNKRNAPAKAKLRMHSGQILDRMKKRQAPDTTSGACSVTIILEATGGFEPPNRGFADPRLRPLGYVALLDAWQ